MKKIELLKNVLASLCLVSAVLLTILTVLESLPQHRMGTYDKKGIVDVVVTELQLLGEDFILNAGTIDELDQLPGVGIVLAERIIAYREIHGPFKSIEGLTAVEGIGSKKMSTIREYLIEQGLYELPSPGSVSYENSP